MIAASILTENDVDDSPQVRPLFVQIFGEIVQMTVDDAYDEDPISQTVIAHCADSAVVIPPRATAFLSAGAATTPRKRDQHIASIAQPGPQYSTSWPGMKVRF
jgi:hypothetical protein